MAVGNCYEVSFVNGDKQLIQKYAFRIVSYILVAVLAAGGTYYAVTGSDSAGQSKLSALEEIIEKYFIGQSDATLMGDAAAQAMVGALGDRWSYYISAADMEAFNEQKNNAYVGIGVTIAERKDGLGLDVVQVTAGGPAEEAGIVIGDTIVAVDGDRLEGMELSASRDLIRGEAGTNVQITVLRDGAEQAVTVQRRHLVVAVATGTMLANNVGYVRIVNFNEHCSEQTIAEVEKLVASGAKQIVFDVRYNPGGYVRELVELLDYLLPAGPLFREENYQGDQHVEYSDEAFLDMPMAVLVNSESYSAAEFFAAALSEYDAAVIVGEQTVGKGYYQNTFMLPDGSAVAISTGKYTTPNGVSLALKGIEPDITVPVDQQTAAAIYAGTLLPEDDPQVTAAVNALLPET